MFLRSLVILMCSLIPHGGVDCVSCRPYSGHQGPVAINIAYLSETHLKLKHREISFVQNIYFSSQIVLKICTGTVVILPCSVQNFKTIWQLNPNLRTYEISRDMGLTCASNRYSILQHLHVLCPAMVNDSLLPTTYLKTVSTIKCFNIS